MYFLKIKNLLLVLIVAVLCGAIGYKLGIVEVKTKLTASRLPNLEIVNKIPDKKSPADFSLFWRVWDEINQKYVDKTKIDSQKMVYGAISGMVASLGDPYTMFLPPVQNKEVKENLNGSFTGIGAELGSKENKIVVIAPLPDSPAQKAGVKTGDWIIKVNNEETAKWTLPETVAKIRGEKGTKVVLNVLHSKETEPVDIMVIRDAIILKSVTLKILENNIAHLQLIRFGDQTSAQWDKAVNEIIASKSAGVILDLRNNPGGLLPGSVYTASEFLRSGIVVKQQSYTGETQTYSVNRVGKLLDIPLVILVNGGTASASEILAGALQAVGRAKLVGMQTFGKGSVQEAEELPGNTGLHLTVAKWLLSNDVWINSKGLTPDLKIENDEKDASADAQLKKAMVILEGA